MRGCLSTELARRSLQCAVFQSCPTQERTCVAFSVPSRPASSLSASSTPPPYYNFKTLRDFPNGPPLPTAEGGSSSPTSEASKSGAAPMPRLYVAHRSGTSDGLPLHNTSPPAADKDPYGHIRIFRRDMAEGSFSSNSSRPVPLSVDVSLKRFQDLFCDYDGKRCKLCNESFLQWYSHQGGVPHAARECLALELVRAHCGSPEEIVKMWWHRLDTSTSFHRIPSLSHSNSHIRKRRVQFLLKYLKDRDIVRDAFNVRQQASSAGRSWEFERLEFLGDNVIKYLFNNRIACLFPVAEGGTRGKIGLFQFLIDGNDGLARAHDFLELQQLTLSDRVVSKFKSDVVETLFGELQVYLWSSQLDLGTEKVPHPFTPGMLALRDLVYHVMEELAHVMIMFHIEYVLSSVQRIAREHQLQFVHTDPLSPKTNGKLNLQGLRDMHISTLSGGQSSPGLALLATRTPYRGSGGTTSASPAPSPFASSHSRGPHHGSGGGERHEAGGAAFYWEAMNYDKFTHVTPLGGLLPRPFRVDDLAPIPTFMPHLQPDCALTERLPRDIAASVVTDMDGVPESVAVQSNRGAGGEGLLAATTPSLSSQRQPTPSRPETLNVSELKDADLVAELL